MRIQISENVYPSIPNTLLLATFSNGCQHVRVVGEIMHANRNKDRQYIYGIKWLISKQEILDICKANNEKEQSTDVINSFIINTNKRNVVSSHADLGYPIVLQDNVLTTLDKDFSPITFMKSIIDNMVSFTFVDDADFDKYITYQYAAQQIDTLYASYSIYKNIILFKDGKPVLKSLIDVLFTLDDKQLQDSLTAFQYSNAYLGTLRSLADHVLENANVTEGVDLMTQEQQVESFINFSKLVSNSKIERVSDETLETMKTSDQYVKILNMLKAKGFGISKTQQFNVLQAAAYLGQLDGSIIYNLSDMGAGKTLMTVESIFLMDLKTIDNFEQDDGEVIATKVHELFIQNKNIIAPKLSIKSSWIETFELFYDVTKIDDTSYKLAIQQNGRTYYSMLYVSAFTTNSNSISVDASLPEPKSKYEYLIIDEVHQIVKRKTNRSKFFAAGTVPNDSYLSFILSGTLSNLTTNEWYNYIMLMGTKFGNSVLDDSTPREMETLLSGEKNNLIAKIAKSAENISSEQKKYFDPKAFNTPQTIIQDDKMSTNKLNMFNLLYASKVLDLYDAKDAESTDDTKPVITDLQSVLLSKKYRLTFDSNIISTPNFELFYQLVGSRAITAQSTQVAEELFGKQKKQHNAEVIKTPSSLSNNDIKLLRNLHEITKDYNVYKSQHIATTINNAILNLNDGLSNKNIYDIISRFANTNTRFLEYLTGLQLNLLEKLSKSSLIVQPKLEDTPKFKVLTNILHKESNETHLIVVNDATAMLKLTKALNIESITKAQLRKPLDYQEILDDMFSKQSIVVVPQMMIKSSLDLIQANRLIQYQLNTEISDIIQTQNRINRIGQKRETKAYYIATDILQKNIIDLFLETYKNIRVAHKGIIELFVDMSSQVNVINDYISKAMINIPDESDYQEPIINDDGTVSLFEVPADINPDVIPTEETTPLNRLVNTNQMSLFTPIEMALEHQLIPQA